MVTGGKTVTTDGGEGCATRVRLVADLVSTMDDESMLERVREDTRDKKKTRWMMKVLFSVVRSRHLSL